MLGLQAFTTVFELILFVLLFVFAVVPVFETGSLHIGCFWVKVSTEIAGVLSHLRLVLLFLLYGFVLTWSCTDVLTELCYLLSLKRMIFKAL